MKMMKKPHKFLFNRIWLVMGLAVLLLLLTTAETPAQDTNDPLWHATYWNNTSLSGEPVLEREENQINYNWGIQSPDAKVHTDNFSIRWTGTFNFEPATYRFAATSDDGMRVWIDGDLLIDEWYDHPVKTVTADKNLRNGSHQIVVEYYEREDGAIAEFWWAPAPPPDGNNWRGEYFNNINLQGEPKLVRQDPEIGFNWDRNPPGEGIRVNKFSARWTRSINMTEGNYRFTMLVDDGARLWVNGRLLIDAWEVQSPQEYTADIYVPGGYIPIKMEYFDNRLGALAQLSWQKTTAQTGVWYGKYYTR